MRITLENGQTTRKILHARRMRTEKSVVRKTRAFMHQRSAGRGVLLVVCE